MAAIQGKTIRQHAIDPENISLATLKEIRRALEA